MCCRFAAQPRMQIGAPREYLTLMEETAGIDASGPSLILMDWNRREFFSVDSLRWRSVRKKVVKGIPSKAIYGISFRR